MKFSQYILTEKYELKKGVEIIEGQIFQLAKHILKVWLIPVSRDYNHWINEIINYLSIMEDGREVKTKTGLISRKVFTREYKDKIKEQKVKNFLFEINVKYKKNFIYRNIYNTELNNFFDFLWDNLSQKIFDISIILNRIKAGI